MEIIPDCLATQEARAPDVIDADRERARTRLAKAMERFYQVPFKHFEKYSPAGSPREVADFLARYRDAGCRLFNIMPIAETEAAGINAVAEIGEWLRSESA